MRYKSVLFGGALLLTSAACQTPAPTATVSDASAKGALTAAGPDQVPAHLSPTTIFKIHSESDFKLWFTYYYMNPGPELVSDAVIYMATHNYMDDHPDVVASFLGHVFAAHPDHLKDWLKSWSELDRRSWSVLLVALWFSGDQKAKILMRVYMDRGEVRRIKDLKTMANSNEDPNLLDLKVHDPRQINLLWAAFSATGDERLVEKVISYVEHYQTVASSPKAAIAEAAIMSLATNVLQHEKVAQVCLIQHQANPSPKIRVLLDAMLTALSRIQSDGANLSH